MTVRSRLFLLQIQPLYIPTQFRNLAQLMLKWDLFGILFIFQAIIWRYCLQGRKSALYVTDTVCQWLFCMQASVVKGLPLCHVIIHFILTISVFPICLVFVKALFQVLQINKFSNIIMPFRKFTVTWVVLFKSPLVNECWRVLCNWLATSLFSTFFVS